MSEQGREAEVRKILARIYASYHSDAPSFGVPIVVNAYYADRCHAFGDKDAAYYACELVVQQVNEADSSRKWQKPADLWYLLYWMKFILSGLSTYLDSSAWELALNIPATFDTLDVGATHRIFTTLFPLDPDKARGFDAYVEECRAIAAEPISPGANPL